MVFPGTLSENKLLKEQAAARVKKLGEFNSDPFMGFATFDEALEACKFTSQAEVLARLFNRENVFISGLAGAGKTAVINRFIDHLDAEYQGNFTVAVTASTGIAATLIGGSTLHSWAGFGISTKPFDPKELDPFILNARKRMKEVDVLVIDEISMLPAYLFTKLDAALRYFRRSDEPFGGVQMVLIGDFLQLPPVQGRNDEADVDYRFAIEAPSWREANIQYCFLDKSYRATDENLKRLLTEMAKGEVSPEMRRLVEERRDLEPTEGKAYTTLFTTNRNVDSYNEERLAASPEPLQVFPTRTTGPKAAVDKAFKAYSVPEVLNLKVGATVILTKNLFTHHPLLANGSMGIIETFVKGRYPRVRFNSGVVMTIEPQVYEQKKKMETIIEGVKVSYDLVEATLHQLPLKLGYAITVHRSQGQTLDGVVLDLSKIFQDGLGYVALSRVRSMRVRSMEDLVITDFHEKAYRVSPKSQKITTYVRKKAYLGRKALLEERDTYETLLTSEFYRSYNWPVGLEE